MSEEARVLLALGLPLTAIPAVLADPWVGITCLAYLCARGCELIACKGPAEPGWTWVDEHGWVCQDCIAEWPGV